MVLLDQTPTGQHVGVTPNTPVQVDIRGVMRFSLPTPVENLHVPVLCDQDIRLSKITVKRVRVMQGLDGRSQLFGEPLVLVWCLDVVSNDEVHNHNIHPNAFGFFTVPYTRRE